MDFELREEQKLVQMSVRQFMLKEIAPEAERIDREDEFPEGIWKRLGELGLLGATIDEEYGGSGFDLLTGVLVNEEMATLVLLATTTRTRVVPSHFLGHRLHPSA